MDARAYVYYLEASLSTKEAKESTTSSGGLSVLVSSPGLYFPVFTGGDQPNESRETLMDGLN